MSGQDNPHQATIRSIAYYRHTFVVKGVEYGYDDIHAVRQRVKRLVVNGIPGPESFTLGFWYGHAESEGRMKYADLSFGIGVLDLVFKRSERLMKVFEWLRERTFDSRLRRAITALSSGSRYALNEVYSLDGEGNIYKRGVCVANVIEAERDGILLYGYERRGMFGGYAGHNDYGFAIGRGWLDYCVKFEMDRNKDVLDVVMARLLRQGRFE